MIKRLIPGSLLSLALSLFVVPSAHSNSYIVDFAYTGAAQSWTVPASVTSITFTVTGASGATANGGAGAIVSGTMTVTPGETLQINVGQRGRSGSALLAAFNGGAGGSLNGSGGGGASDIRTGAYALANRVVVAGGGGGGDGGSIGVYGFGGDAGYPNGSAGGYAGGAPQYIGAPGGGATQSAGGVGGTQSSGCGWTNGSAGTLGIGGEGSQTSSGGSGGGGGYYGGGGGGSGCNASGGGGGSSYVNSSLVSGVTSSVQTTRAAGAVRITYIGVDTTAPTFPSADAFSVAENSTAIANVVASESSTISIFGGVDQSFFTLSRLSDSSSALAFASARDYESPQDGGANNTYVVVLRAVDAASNAGYETITVTVTDVLDSSSINAMTLSGAVNYRIAVTISVNVTVPSTVEFRVDGKRIPGCIKKATTGTSPNIVASCVWRPSRRGAATLIANASPTQGGITGTSAVLRIAVGNRSTTR